MITRFAPSPTGPLHLGHALSALLVWDMAKRLGGTALLRIEDTDSTRCRPAYSKAIADDLTWLGLTWPEPVRVQSQHGPDYTATLDRLAALGLLYPCACTRRQISENGGTPGTDGMIYPGTCRDRTMASARPTDALRLNLRAALRRITGPLRYRDTGTGADQEITITPARLIAETGDPVLRRINTGDPAYHLACTHDDAVQTITHVVRGADIAPLTPIHVLLQRLLDYPTPLYHHHRLITDAAGKRLAKIDKSKAISSYRAEGATPQDIRRMIAFP